MRKPLGRHATHSERYKVAKKSGKKLEHLAREIERRLLPKGFEVLANEKVFNDSGVQIAEFDIIVKGNLGSTSFKWLIECRDRPSKRRSAPGAWIEQLVGRKYLFGFDKVTAVSTTGFSKGAKGLAKLGNIELRTVSTLTLDFIADWFPLTTVTVLSTYLSVEHVTFVGVDTDAQAYEEVKARLKSQSTSSKARMLMPVHPKTGEPLNVIAAFYERVNQNPHLLDGFEADGESRPIKCKLKYPDPFERYQFVAAAGLVYVGEVEFEGTFTITKSDIPIAQITEYYKTFGNEPIAQSVRFTTEVADRSVDLYFHNLGEKDKTFVSAQIRKADDATQDGVDVAA